MPYDCLVTVSLVCHNELAYLPQTLRAIKEQTHKKIELVIVDNASTDGTFEYLKEHYSTAKLIFNTKNSGFTIGHNQAIRASTGQFVQVLNPDVKLTPGYIEELINAAKEYEQVGVFAGKLLRIGKYFEPLSSDIIDSTGMIVTPTGRHFDLGSGEYDTGKYNSVAFVFGATGAAPLLRRKMLDDIAYYGQYFDEDIHFGHDDFDLAWRAQRAGWKALYIPRAVAYHVRFSRQDNIGQMPHWQRVESMKNRFMVRIKNMSWRQFFIMALPMFVWDTLLFGYTLLKQPYAFKGLWELGKLMPQNIKKRKHIFRHAYVPDSSIRRWFKFHPVVDEVN